MRRYLAAILLATFAGPAAAAGLTGHWLSASGNVDVEIAPCAPPPNTLLCGTIARVLSNQSMSGPGQMASTTNDVGLKILIDFAPAADGTFQGRLLNRENGKIYDGTLRLNGPDELEVRGYVLISLFGKTQIWHRLP